MQESVSIGKVQKRDGRLQDFDQTKIANAIAKAFAATRQPNGDLAANLAAQVTQRVAQRFENRIPRVEDVQDEVERVLMERDVYKRQT